MNFCRNASTLFLASSLLATSNAQIHVGPAVFYESAQTQGGFFTASGPGDLQSHYTAFNPTVIGNSESFVTLNGVPFLSAHADLTGASTARTDTELRYDFQIVGPANVVVPIIVHVGLLSVSVTRSGGSADLYSIASAEATLGISNQDGGGGTGSSNVMYRDHVLDQFGSPLDSGNNFLTDTTVRTRANKDVVTFVMDSFAEVTAAGSISAGIANSYLDPYISIDPSFADASLYSIVLSPGIPNTQPVPEPSALLALGLGALTLLRRRKRASRVAFPRLRLHS